MSEQESERGFRLTESERRYAELFGGPGFRTGPARRPTSPGLRIAYGGNAGTSGGSNRAPSEVDGQNEVDAGGL